MGPLLLNQARSYAFVMALLLAGAVYLFLTRTDLGKALRAAAEFLNQALLERNLALYDCVFLCDVAQFTEGEAQVLRAYLRSGGNLVFFDGDDLIPFSDPTGP
jgi:hypothetical protein